MEVEPMMTESAQRAEWARICAKFAPMSAQAVEPGPGFDARVAAGVRRDRRRERARRALLATAKAAAVAAALAAAFAALPGMFGTGGAGAAASAAGGTEWLVANQRADGTWEAPGGSRAYSPALTALAAIALARRGGAEDAAERAVASLESMQRPDGSFGEGGTSVLYNHALATFALAEDAMRRGRGITPALERAIGFSLSAQDAAGCWDYPGGEGGNAALTIWQAGALARARELGWADSKGGLRRAVRWLSLHEDGGILDYRIALRRETEPASGGAILTALATESLSGFLAAHPGMERMVADLNASLEMAGARMSLAASDSGRPCRDAFAAAIAMLSAGK